MVILGQFSQRCAWGLKIPRGVYFVVGDASHLYENAHAKEVWCALPESDGDLIEARPGVGRRLNQYEFMDPDGIVRHPDGNSAGTHYDASLTQGRDDFLRALECGCVAIRAKSDWLGAKTAILLLDGAKVQKTMSEDAINPHHINLSDGGKNRKPMRVIGMRGLRSVLRELRV